MDKSLPVRKSANPVLGVNRCECGDIRTIHQAKGKRSKFLYSICDTCGTDQRTGRPVQEKLQQYFETMPELLASEQQTQSEKQIVVKETPQTLPEPSGENGGIKPENPAATNVADRTGTQTGAKTTASIETEDKPPEAHGGWFALLCFAALSLAVLLAVQSLNSVK